MASPCIAVAKVICLVDNMLPASAMSGIALLERVYRH